MRELLARGAAVRVVNRSGSGSFPDAVEVCSGDAADRNFARHVSRGASVVYQCLNAPYHRWRELFPRMQAGVVEGAAAAGAKLVSMENVYMYGSPYGKPLTERRPMTAMTRKGRVRAEMSEALLQAHRKGRVRVAIGRASDFFGPEVVESAMGARVFRAALRGETVDVIGDVTMPHTYGYVPDIARGLVILGQRDEALGEVWHLPGPETVTTREFLTMVFAESGRAPDVRRVGKGTLRLLGFFKPQVRELVEMMYQFEEPFVVDHTKFVEAFGDIATPLTDAIRTTVEWFREREAAASEATGDDAAGEHSDDEVPADADAGEIVDEPPLEAVEPSASNDSEAERDAVQKSTE
jgi:nucleoside-diphosphate-sugar epimerase